jgi:large subunit ribosomal protein L24
MKQKFSKHWKASIQPRKQRKYLARAPLHIKRKFLSVNLSKELRKKYNRRNIPVRKEDTVKIMRGKFKGKKGKIISINTKNSGVKIEGITIKKQDGSKVGVKIYPSNLQITELNLNDKKRIKEKSNKKIKEENKKQEERK